MEVKPRVKFCWECGKKLWGNHFVEENIDGYSRILHKRCKEYRESLYYDEDDWIYKISNEISDWK